MTPSSARRIVYLVMIALVPASARADVPVTWDELRKLPSDCPIIYDNDWLGDTNDDEYLFAKAHLGQAKLRGVILTKDQWDSGKHYSVKQGLDDFNAGIAVARRSGLRHIPDVAIGAETFLKKPASGKVEDAMPVASAGSDLIVAEARKASPEKPLVVIVGGPLCTVANAYLTDPSIADRMIVMMTDIDGYNGTDKWANFLVATRCKLVNFGANPLWWPQPPLPPSMPLDRFDALPDSEVVQAMRKVAKGFRERSTRKEKPDRDDGFAGGAGTFLLFQPKTWQGVKKQKVTGIWSHQEATEGPYSYLDATQIDTPAMTEEFFTTLAAALRSAEAKTGSKTPSR